MKAIGTAIGTALTGIAIVGGMLIAMALLHALAGAL